MPSVRSVSGKTPIRRIAPEKYFLVVPLNFLDLKTQLVVSCLLFFCSRCPRVQPFEKVGGGARAPVQWRIQKF